MTVIEVFVFLLAVAAGIGLGWYIRGRPEAASDADPEAELRELRDVHATCGTQIRNLHIELSQLESALAIAGLNPQRQPPATSTKDDGVQAGNGAAARLASIIEALGHDESDDMDSDDAHGPAAFMSILPANLVEEGVKEAAEAEAARNAIEEPESEITPDLEDAVVIDLADSDDSMSVEVARRDDLKLIKGIGPKIESVLHEHGITTFQQIAELDDEAIARLDEVLGAFRGRIERDDWVGSAQDLVAEHSVSS
jgi:predicted flap endonuclease-1-like 5' DNA nuclease